VVVRLKDRPPSLGDRYRVDVRVILEEKPDVILVPEAALFREGGEWRAFAVEGGRARKRTVRTGIRDGRNREVLGGLAEGDRVVLFPPDDLADGDRVHATAGGGD
jgi:HlyD family secretion protein